MGQQPSDRKSMADGHIASNVQASARQHRSDRVGLSPDWFSDAAPFLDVVMILGFGAAAYAASDTWIASRLWIYLGLSLGFSLAIVWSLRLSGAYDFEIISSPIRHLWRIALPALGAASAVTIGAYVFLQALYWNEFWFAAMVAGGAAAVVAGRILLFIVILTGARRGWIRRRIAVLGAGEHGMRLVGELARDPLRINHVVGVYDDRCPAPGRLPPDARRDGAAQDLVGKARALQVDDIIVALPWRADERLKRIVSELSACPARVHVGADLAAFSFATRLRTDLSAGFPMLTVSSNPLSGWRRLAKSIEDRSLAILLVFLFSPVMAAIAIAIALDSRGPIIFKQKRYGFNNQLFDVFKFRSMTHDPAMSRDGAVKTTTQQATQHDARITRVGRFIRRTSLDELPQLFNVLNGTMSLVGPRPHAVDHNEDYGRRIDGYFIRHKVKPGITGLAQINGLRGETDTLDKMEYRIRYDRYYVEHWSVLLDLEILALTAFTGFVGKNAY